MTYEEKLKKAKKNRADLSRQDEWAYKKSKKNHMEKVTIKERTYGKGNREKLDYIYPKESMEEKMPVFIYIHGGGWIAGQKECRRVYLGKFAELGFFVVNIEYELAPEMIFPGQIDQCMHAVDFFLDEANSLPVDVNRIACGGESAGVYYAAFVAAISKDNSIAEKIGITKLRHTEFDIKVNFFNCGAVEFKRMLESKFPNAELMVEAYTYGVSQNEWDKLSPMHYVQENFPKTYMLYGQLDCLKNNSFYMQEIFEKKGISYELHKVSGVFYGNHTASIILMTPKAFKILKQATDFMKANM